MYILYSLYYLPLCKAFPGTRFFTLLQLQKFYIKCFTALNIFLEQQVNYSVGTAISCAYTITFINTTGDMAEYKQT